MFFNYETKNKKSFQEKKNWWDSSYQFVNSFLSISYDCNIYTRGTKRKEFKKGKKKSRACTIQIWKRIKGSTFINDIIKTMFLRIVELIVYLPRFCVESTSSSFSGISCTRCTNVSILLHLNNKLDNLLYCIEFYKYRPYSSLILNQLLLALTLVICLTFLIM